MFKSFLHDAIEIIWLVSLIGGLSLVGVGIALALAFWLDHLAMVAAHV